MPAYMGFSTTLIVDDTLRISYAELSDANTTYSLTVRANTFSYVSPDVSVNVHITDLCSSANITLPTVSNEIYYV